MIAGPILPRTRDGLRHLVEQHTSLIEHGLEPIHPEVEIDGAGRIPYLARDAIGAPVAILYAPLPGSWAADGSEAASERTPWQILADRCVDLSRWLRRHGHSLRQLLPDASFAARARPRVIVVGLEIHDALLRDLRDLRARDPELAELEVFQFLALESSGRRALASVSMLRDSAEVARMAFEPPAGLEPEARACAEALLAILHRLDPRLEVEIDRYSRRYAHSGVCLLRVANSGGELEFRYGEEREVVRTVDQGLRALDAVFRAFLELLDCGLLDGDARDPDPFGILLERGERLPGVRRAAEVDDAVRGDELDRRLRGLEDEVVRRALPAGRRLFDRDREPRATERPNG